MSKFIELHDVDQEPVFVNVEKIGLVYREDNKNFIELFSGYFQVAETPAEIMVKIQEVQNG